MLLSARRVGPTGFAYGVDMTDEMLDARPGQRREGRRDQRGVPSRARSRTIPLPDASVDVVISNCVINLSTDKPAVLAEMFRVLAPGGRLGISDVVAEDHLSPAERAERGSYVGCIAGALSPPRVPRRPRRRRLHRRDRHVHPRGRARHARRDRPGGQAVDPADACCSSASTTPAAPRWPPAGCTHLAGDRVEVRSAGSEPGDRVNPVAVAAMAEDGIDISAEHPEAADHRRRPRPPTSSSPWAAATPARSSPASGTRTGTCEDPAGQGIDAVRPIRDDIRRRVEQLLDDLLPTGVRPPVPSRPSG